MTDMFAKPGSATGVNWADYMGRLIVFYPHAIEKGITTAVGVKDAVRADLIIIDGPDSPETISDTLVFPLKLQGQIKWAVGTGQPLLGRLGQGDKKPGQNAPWMLGDPTPEDEATAGAVLAKISTPTRVTAAAGAGAGAGINAEPPF